MNLIHLTIELVVGFLFLFLIVKFVGKKMMNTITPFTFIASIVFGELLGNALYDPKINTLYIIYSISLWGFLLFIVEIFAQKSLSFRGIVEGKPSALIKNGIVSREALKKCHMNMNQLQSLLRQSETFSIREVAFCYLEANGSLSILKKPKYQKVTLEDMNLQGKQVYVPVTIIRDGKVLWDEIQDLGYDEQWLTSHLQSHGVTHTKDIFIAEWQEDNGLLIQTFEQST